MNLITDENQPKLSKPDFDKNRIEVYKTRKVGRNRLSTKTNGLKIDQNGQKLNKNSEKTTLNHEILTKILAESPAII